MLNNLIKIICFTFFLISHILIADEFELRNSVSYKVKLPDVDLTIFSNIAKTEGDCLRDGRKDLYIAYYDQKMGKGNKVLEDTNPSEEWTYNEPGSVYYDTLRFVCDNK